MWDALNINPFFLLSCRPSWKNIFEILRHYSLCPLYFFWPFFTLSEALISAICVFSCCGAPPFICTWEIFSGVQPLYLTSELKQVLKSHESTKGHREEKWREGSLNINHNIFRKNLTEVCWISFTLSFRIFYTNHIKFSLFSFLMCWLAWPSTIVIKLNTGKWSQIVKIMMLNS